MQVYNIAFQQSWTNTGMLRVGKFDVVAVVVMVIII